MAQCEATAKSTGNRCKKDAIPGTNVCHVHGGNAPQVREKAEERLRKAAAPAIADLDETREEVREIIEDLRAEVEVSDLLDDEDVNKSDLLYLLMSLSGHHRGLVDDILDRAGFPRVDRQEVTGKKGGPVKYFEVEDEWPDTDEE